MSKKKKYNKAKREMKITSEQLLVLERQVRRQVGIEQGNLHFKGGVEKSKKTYTRKPKHKKQINQD